jgi:hypothetical protein
MLPIGDIVHRVGTSLPVQIALVAGAIAVAANAPNPTARSLLLGSTLAFVVSARIQHTGTSALDVYYAIRAVDKSGQVLDQSIADMIGTRPTLCARVPARTPAHARLPCLPVSARPQVGASEHQGCQTILLRPPAADEWNASIIALAVHLEFAIEPANRGKKLDLSFATEDPDYRAVNKMLADKERVRHTHITACCSPLSLDRTRATKGTLLAVTEWLSVTDWPTCNSQMTATMESATIRERLLEMLGREESPDDGPLGIPGVGSCNGTRTRARVRKNFKKAKPAKTGCCKDKPGASTAGAGCCKDEGGGGGGGDGGGGGGGGG